MSYLKILLNILLISQITSYKIPLNPRIQKPSLRISMLDRKDFINIGGFSLIYYGINSAYLDLLKKNNYYEYNQIKIFKETSKSVCFISTEYSNVASNLDIDVDNLPKGVGTGFLWDDEGHIITNFHVINKVNNAVIKINNETYKAKLTGIDPDNDIAVLKIDFEKGQENLKPIPLGDINDIEIGQFSYAIGNPFGQDHTYTSGIISGLNREITSPTGRKIKGVIQTDTAINPGNSGGPLLNSKGRLVGMNTATFGNGISSGVGFAVPINIIKKSVEEIIKFGGIQKAIIGISYLDRLPSAFESKQMGIPEVKKGVIILSVPTNSTTGLKGIKMIGDKKVKLGDIIIGIDGIDINNPMELTSILEKHKPNDIVKLKIIRDDKEMIIDVSLTSYKTKSFTNMKIDIPIKNIAPQLSP